MRKVPLFKVSIHPSVAKAVEETLLSGYVGQGPRVEQFEALLKQRLNYPHLVTLNSATAGLYLALQLAGVGPGHEVISTPNTCSATNLPILHRFAKIKWADVDPTTCNIDVDSVVKLASRDTKAIIVVLWGGYPVRVDELQAKLKKKGLEIPIIQDCAHAFGSFYKGAHVGTSGETYASFSFQAIKQFTTGDGGMLLTPANEYSRVKLLRWYGIDRENPNAKDLRCEIDIREGGLKWHMNDINATIGIHQLPYVDEIIRVHRENAAFYRQNLSGLPGIQLMKDETDCQSASWLFTLLVERRADFMKMMAAHGVVTSRVHERNDIHSCMKEYRCHLPQLELMSDKIVNIPVGWWVSHEDREFIVEKIKEGW